MGRVTRYPFLRLQPGGEGFGRSQDAIELDQVGVGLDLRQRQPARPLPLARREEEHHLFLHVREDRPPESDDVNLREGVPQVLAKGGGIAGMDELRRQDQCETPSRP